MKLHASFAIPALLAVAGCDLFRPSAPFDEDREAPTTQVTSGRLGEDKDPEVSPDAKLLYFASTSFGETFDIYVKAIGSNTASRLTTIPGDKRFPSVNPADPRWLAFCTNARGEWEIALTNTADAAGRVEYVGESGRHCIHPSWSPDGRMLAYCSTGDLGSGEWTLRIRDLQARRTTRLDDIDGLLPRWSPRGDKIAFQRMKHRDGWLGGLWTVDVEAGSAKHLTMIFSSDDWAAIHPAWSPDGRRIVFATVGKSRARAGVLNEGDDLWMVDADGAHATRLTASPAAEGMPVWSSDGTIFFTSNRSGSYRIWSLRAPPSDRGVTGF